MGIATSLEQAIDGLLSNYVNSKSAAFCSALAPIALTGLTIYFVVMAYAAVRGEMQDTVNVAVGKFLRLAFITAIALNAGQYQETVVGGLQGIQGAFIETLGGQSSIGALIDDMSEPYNKLGSAIWSKVEMSTIPSLSLLAAGFIVAVAQAFIFIVCLGLYLLSKIAFALSLAVGPPYILAACFPATQKFTENWLGQALNFVILNSLLAGSIAMLTDFASQYADHISKNIGTTNLLNDVAALLLVSGALAFVVLNHAQLASALAGGASIQGIGRTLARGLMDYLTRDKEGGGKRTKTP